MAFLSETEYSALQEMMRDWMWILSSDIWLDG